MRGRDQVIGIDTLSSMQAGLILVIKFHPVERIALRDKLRDTHSISIFMQKGLVHRRSIEAVIASEVHGIGDHSYLTDILQRRQVYPKVVHQQRTLRTELHPLGQPRKAHITLLISTLQDAYLLPLGDEGNIQIAERSPISSPPVRPTGTVPLYLAQRPSLLTLRVVEGDLVINIVGIGEVYPRWY